MIFIDTGAFIARYIARDEHHKNAVTFWESLEKNKDQVQDPEKMGIPK